jgi:uncharacterized protein
MNLISMVPLFSVLHGAPVSAQSIHPGFDCMKASSADERSICKYSKLAQLDLAITIAVKQVGEKQIKSATDTTGYLTERRNCGWSAVCILDVQVREISALDRYGARIPMPSWIGSYRLFLLNDSRQTLVGFLPMSIGRCTKTKIVGMTMRSGDPSKQPIDDTAYQMSVEYEDRGFQIASKYVPDLAASSPGDNVVLCLDAIPTYCLWNEHVRIYSATNLRTKGSWIMPDPDAQQVCGKGGLAVGGPGAN